MNFFKQIKIELVHILKHKFILIVSILFLLIGVAGPILSYAMDKYYENQRDNYYQEYAVMETSMNGATAVFEVGGASESMDKEDPFYYEIRNYEVDMLMTLEDLKANGEQKVYEYAEALRLEQLDYFLEESQIITDNLDYRTDLVHKASELLNELFVLKSDPEDKDEVIMAVQMITWIEDVEKLTDADEETRKALTEEIQERFDKINEVIVANDFAQYINLMISFENEDIEGAKKLIEVQEKAVIENPELEESANREILRLEGEIERIEKYRIPAWEYRLEHNIKTTDDAWQNSALNSLESTVYQIQDTKNSIMTEEEFAQDEFISSEYESYAEYVESQNKQIQAFEKDLMITQNSLQAGKPDMRFVRDGARSAVNSYLVYSLIVAFLAILIGGYMIASDFQAGTIRLLMVRPRTRMKVYSARYVAGLILGLGVYLGGMISNIIVNGIILGFSDYAYPNYTASGEVGFWGLIIGRILICSVTVIFAYTLAFVFSAVVRNVAISIALPCAGVLGGYVLMQMLAYSRFAKIMAWTPLVFINLSDFFQRYSGVVDMMENGVEVNLAYGVVLLLVLSIAMFGFGIWNFMKRDITN